MSNRLHVLPRHRPPSIPPGLRPFCQEGLSAAHARFSGHNGVSAGVAPGGCAPGGVCRLATTGVPAAWPDSGPNVGASSRTAAIRDLAGRPEFVIGCRRFVAVVVTRRLGRRGLRNRRSEVRILSGALTKAPQPRVFHRCRAEDEHPSGQSIGHQSRDWTGVCLRGILGERCRGRTWRWCGGGSTATTSATSMAWSS